MGTTGRNAVIWLFIISITVTLITKILNYDLACRVVFLLVLIFAIAWFKFTLYDMPQAREKSIKLGLEAIDLVPLNRRWAKWLVGKLDGEVVCAYEIHLRLQQMEPRKLIKAMEKDLAFIERDMQGLFLWETSVAVPHRIRKIIKEYEAKGRAYWLNGPWPVPAPPFIGTKPKTKKPIRRGAIIIGGG